MTERHATYSAELEHMLEQMTPKQSFFCREYVIDFNAARAARDAGYSAHSAREIGYENLTKPHIMAFIDDFLGRKCDDITISAEVIEREYWILYRDSLAHGERNVARACLKDLGEYHAMFVKQVAFLDSGQLEARLAKGRARMNESLAPPDATLQ